MKLPFSPVSNDLLQVVQMTFEKMVRVFDYMQLDVGIFLKQRRQRRDSILITKLVPVAVHKENRLTVCFKKTEIIFIYRRADAN